MSVSIKTRQAYSEIDEFLGLLTEEQRNEIPKKLREFFKEEKDKVIFLHKVKNGPVDKSYGIHVASLVGLPSTIIKRAREILNVYEHE